MKHGLFDPYSDPFGRDRIPAAPTWAEILTIKKGCFCDIRLFSGEEIPDVPLPEGSVIDGKGKGRFGRFREGQRVLVQFIDGHRDNPVVTDSYSLPGETKYADANDLKNFSDAPENSGLSSDSEDWEDHHPSGYRVRYTDQEILVEKGQTAVVTIDIQNDVYTIKMGQLKVGSGGISVSDGDKLLSYLQDLQAKLSAILAVIQAAPTTPGDGGAAFKAAIVTAIRANTLQPPPTDLNQTNTKINSA